MFTLRLLKIKIHSRRVMMFKRSLPIFAFLLASMIFIWPAVVKNKDKFNLAVPAPNVKKGANVDMERVRFFSKDKQKQPLTVLATTVQEIDTDKKIIRLDQPIATYEMKDGVILNSVTTYGLAYQKEEYLFFDEEIQSTTDNGYIAWSSGVKCDYENGTLDSDRKVLVRGVGGTLNANGFYMEDKGNVIDFKGDSRAVLFNKEKPLSVMKNPATVRASKAFNALPADLILSGKDGIQIRQQPQTITAIGQAQMKQLKTVLDADKIVIHYTKDKANRVSRLDALGQAVVRQPENSVYANEMTFYDNKNDINEQLKERNLTEAFAKSGGKQIVVAKGNVKVLEKDNTIVADEMVVFTDRTSVNQKMKKVVATGNVKAFNKTQQIYGDAGDYNPQTGLVVMTGDVLLSEGNNHARGTKATLNLNTGISTLNAETKDNTTGGRVKGSLIPAEI